MSVDLLRELPWNFLTALVTGGLLAKALDIWFSRHTSERQSRTDIQGKEIDDGARLRMELRDQNRELWERIQDIETALARCRRESAELEARALRQDVTIAMLREQVEAFNRPRGE